MPARCSGGSLPFIEHVVSTNCRCDYCSLNALGALAVESDAKALPRAAWRCIVRRLAESRGCDMLEVLQQWLSAGPVETTVLFHGSQTSASAKVKILSADAIGVVLQVSGWRGAYGRSRLHPWGSISLIESPADE